jgi:RND family efflux transporter MFP subunit
MHALAADFACFGGMRDDMKMRNFCAFWFWSTDFRGYVKMVAPRVQPYVALCLLFCLMSFHPAWAEGEREWSPAGKPPETGFQPPVSQRGFGPTPLVSIETVVINPYRAANVGTRVAGVISVFKYEEGDFIHEGELVVEVDTTPYSLAVQKSEDRVKQLDAAFQRAADEARVKRELLDLGATTRQELFKAEAEHEIAKFRVDEEKKVLELACFELEACRIKAPFTGYLAVRYKQPAETVERLEKVFAMVDSSKVHAVANVPETVLDQFAKGAQAVFALTPEKVFRGVVDRVGKIIDPKSRTKRVYLLIDNAAGELEVGMTGTLQLVR